jgi:beta-lactamase class A
VLVLLIAVVGLLSVGGPAALAEAIRGLTFSPPRPATLPAPAPRLDPALQARIDDAAVLPQGTLGVSVVDLNTGALAQINPDRPFPAASLFKLPILVQVLADEAAGTLDPDALLEVRQEDWTDGSGVLQARVGDRLPVHELVQLMIQDSDNIAALVLLDQVGVSNVNATASRLGLEHTHVVDHRAGEDGDHVTTAADMAQLLLNIARGQLINPDISQQALQLLELKQANTWLAEDLPWWVKVAHKWGDLPEARNDAGIVFTPRGSYLAVVLTENARPDAAEQAIARTAAAAYAYLGTRPG